MKLRKFFSIAFATGTLLLVCRAAAAEETTTPEISAPAVEQSQEERLEKQRLVTEFDTEIARAKEEYDIHYSAFTVVKSCYADDATLQGCKDAVQAGKLDLAGQINLKLKEAVAEKDADKNQNVTIVNIDQSEEYYRRRWWWRRTPRPIPPAPTRWEPGALPKPSRLIPPKEESGVPRRSERPHSQRNIK